MGLFQNRNAPLLASYNQICCLRPGLALKPRRPLGSEFRARSFHLSSRIASPFTGSEPEGKASAEVLQLSFQEAIDRGLRNNLGLLLSGDQAITARGERWKELSNLLPDLSARIQEDAQTLSLTALGFKSNVFPFPVPRVIGPFNYFDARASVTQSLFSFHDIEKATRLRRRV